MQKVIIIGCPGSGKSFFSKKLNEVTKLPLYHLDNIYHKQDGTHISREEFDNKLQEIFQKEKWIMDGNYQRTLEVRIKEADTIFLLDFNTETCINGALDRVGKDRDDIPWKEDKLNEEFKEFILNFSKNQLPVIYELLDKYKEKNIIIFKNREEIETYISTQQKDY